MKLQSATLMSALALQACEMNRGLTETPASPTPESTESDAAAAQPEPAPALAPEPMPADPSYRLSKRQIRSMYAGASCDSLGGLVDYLDQTGATDYFRGLSARIRVPPAGAQTNQWYSLDRFAQNDAVTLPSTLYFQQLNVPTRRFSEGFPTFSGARIKGANQADLVEFFRLDFDAGLKLTADFTEGNYEFAILADDGARFEVGEGAGKQTLINHPADTQTKLMCGAAPVALSRTAELPMHLSYFQGPRYHIALTLLWRPANATPDPMCGRSGNDLWFDSSRTPSVPRAAYNGLAARGWSVVPADVFRIPHSEYMNPCASDHVQDVIDETCTAAECEGTGI